MREFKVPFGKASTGALVAPRDALKTETYVCPAAECGSPLKIREGQKVLKSGAKISRHFYHPANSDCSKDLVTHAVAERLIVQAISDWKSGSGEKPQIQFNCPKCLAWKIWQLPDSIEEATLEQRVALGEQSFRIDVALKPWDDHKIAVEIYNTHRVEDEKHKALLANGIRAYEIEASAVLERPTMWRLLETQDLIKRCDECAVKEETLEKQRLESEARRDQIEKELRARQQWRDKEAREEAERERERQWKRNIYLPKFKHLAERLAAAQKIWLPHNHFRYFLIYCWKCGKRTFAYTWPNKKNNDSFLPEFALRSRPASLKFVPIKGTRQKYWANTCAICESVQGERGITYPYCRQWTYDDFVKDMGDIAIEHYETSKSLL